MSPIFSTDLVAGGKLFSSSDLKNRKMVLKDGGCKVLLDFKSQAEGIA